MNVTIGARITSFDLSLISSEGFKILSSTTAFCSSSSTLYSCATFLATSKFTDWLILAKMPILMRRAMRSLGLTVKPSAKSFTVIGVRSWTLRTFGASCTTAADAEGIAAKPCDEAIECFFMDGAWGLGLCGKTVCGLLKDGVELTEEAAVETGLDLISANEEAEAALAALRCKRSCCLTLSIEPGCDEGTLGGSLEAAPACGLEGVLAPDANAVFIFSASVPDKTLIWLLAPILSALSLSMNSFELSLYFLASS